MEEPIVIISSESEDEEELRLEKGRPLNFNLIKLRKKVMEILVLKQNEDLQNFPYEKFSDFVVELKTALKILDQRSNAKLIFFWKMAIQWIMAIKLTYSDAVRDLKEDPKFNLLLTDVMGEFIHFRCNVSIKYCRNSSNFESSVNYIIRILSLVFSKNICFIQMTLLKIKAFHEYREILNPIFEKFLSDRRKKVVTDLISYLRTVFYCIQWKNLFHTKEEKEKINELAVGLSRKAMRNTKTIDLEADGILPKYVPTVLDSNRCFTSISDLIRFAIKKENMGTRTLLINKSLDFEEAVKKFFVHYERYIKTVDFQTNFVKADDYDESDFNLKNLQISTRSNRKTVKPSSPTLINYEIWSDNLSSKSTETKTSTYDNLTTENTAKTRKNKHLDSNCDINLSNLRKNYYINNDYYAESNIQFIENSNLESVINLDSSSEDDGSTESIVLKSNSIQHKYNVKNTIASNITNTEKILQQKNEREKQHSGNYAVITGSESESEEVDIIKNLVAKKICYNKLQPRMPTLGNDKSCKEDSGKSLTKTNMASSLPTDYFVAKTLPSKNKTFNHFPFSTRRSQIIGPSKKLKDCIPGEVSSTTLENTLSTIPSTSATNICTSVVNPVNILNNSGDSVEQTVNFGTDGVSAGDGLISVQNAREVGSGTLYNNYSDISSSDSGDNSENENNDEKLKNHIKIKKNEHYIGLSSQLCQINPSKKAHNILFGEVDEAISSTSGGIDNFISNRNQFVKKQQDIQQTSSQNKKLKNLVSVPKNKIEKKLSSDILDSSKTETDKSTRISSDISSKSQKITRDTEHIDINKSSFSNSSLTSSMKFSKLSHEKQNPVIDTKAIVPYSINLVNRSKINESVINHPLSSSSSNLGTFAVTARTTKVNDNNLNLKLESKKGIDDCSKTTAVINAIIKNINCQSDSPINEIKTREIMDLTNQNHSKERESKNIGQSEENISIIKNNEEKVLFSVNVTFSSSGHSLTNSSCSNKEKLEEHGLKKIIFSSNSKNLNTLYELNCTTNEESKDFVKSDNAETTETVSFDKNECLNKTKIISTQQSKNISNDCFYKKIMGQSAREATCTVKSNGISNQINEQEKKNILQLRKNPKGLSNKVPNSNLSIFVGKVDEEDLLKIKNDTLENFDETGEVNDNSKQQSLTYSALTSSNLDNNNDLDAINKTAEKIEEKTTNNDHNSIHVNNLICTKNSQKIVDNNDIENMKKNDKKESFTSESLTLSIPNHKDNSDTIKQYIGENNKINNSISNLICTVAPVRTILSNGIGKVNDKNYQSLPCQGLTFSKPDNLNNKDEDNSIQVNNFLCAESSDKIVHSNGIGNEKLNCKNKFLSSQDLTLSKLDDKIDTSKTKKVEKLEENSTMKDQNSIHVNNRICTEDLDKIVQNNDIGNVSGICKEQFLVFEDLTLSAQNHKDDLDKIMKTEDIEENTTIKDHDSINENNIICTQIGDKIVDNNNIGNVNKIYKDQFLTYEGLTLSTQNHTDDSDKKKKAEDIEENTTIKDQDLLNENDIICTETGDKIVDNDNIGNVNEICKEQFLTYEGLTLSTQNHTDDSDKIKKAEDIEENTTIKDLVFINENNITCTETGDKIVDNNNIGNVNEICKEQFLTYEGLTLSTQNQTDDSNKIKKAEHIEENTTIKDHDSINENNIICAETGDKIVDNDNIGNVNEICKEQFLTYEGLTLSTQNHTDDSDKIKKAEDIEENTTIKDQDLLNENDIICTETGDKIVDNDNIGNVNEIYKEQFLTYEGLTLSTQNHTDDSDNTKKAEDIEENTTIKDLVLINENNITSTETGDKIVDNNNIGNVNEICKEQFLTYEGLTLSTQNQTDDSDKIKKAEHIEENATIKDHDSINLNNIICAETGDKIVDNYNIGNVHEICKEQFLTYESLTLSTQNQTDDSYKIKKAEDIKENTTIKDHDSINENKIIRAETIDETVDNNNIENVNEICEEQFLTYDGLTLSTQNHTDDSDNIKKAENIEENTTIKDHDSINLNNIICAETGDETVDNNNIGNVNEICKEQCTETGDKIVDNNNIGNVNEICKEQFLTYEGLTLSTQNQTDDSDFIKKAEEIEENTTIKDHDSINENNIICTETLDKIVDNNNIGNVNEICKEQFLTYEGLTLSTQNQTDDSDKIKKAEHIEENTTIKDHDSINLNNIICTETGDKIVDNNNIGNVNEICKKQFLTYEDLTLSTQNHADDSDKIKKAEDIDEITTKQDHDVISISNITCTEAIDKVVDNNYIGNISGICKEQFLTCDGLILPTQSKNDSVKIMKVKEIEENSTINDHESISINNVICVEAVDKIVDNNDIENIHGICKEQFLTNQNLTLSIQNHKYDSEKIKKAKNIKENTTIKDDDSINENNIICTETGDKIVDYNDIGNVNGIYKEQLLTNEGLTLLTQNHTDDSDKIKKAEDIDETTTKQDHDVISTNNITCTEAIDKVVDNNYIGNISGICKEQFLTCDGLILPTQSKNDSVKIMKVEEIEENSTINDHESISINNVICVEAVDKIVDNNDIENIHGICKEQFLTNQNLTLSTQNHKYDSDKINKANNIICAETSDELVPNNDVGKVNVICRQQSLKSEELSLSKTDQGNLDQIMKAQNCQKDVTMNDHKSIIVNDVILQDVTDKIRHNSDVEESQHCLDSNHSPDYVSEKNKFSEKINKKEYEIHIKNSELNTAEKFGMLVNSEKNKCHAILNKNSIKINAKDLEVLKPSSFSKTTINGELYMRKVLKNVNLSKSNSNSKSGQKINDIAEKMIIRNLSKYHHNTDSHNDSTQYNCEQVNSKDKADKIFVAQNHLRLLSADEIEKCQSKNLDKSLQIHKTENNFKENTKNTIENKRDHTFDKQNRINVFDEIFEESGIHKNLIPYKNQKQDQNIIDGNMESRDEENIKKISEIFHDENKDLPNLINEKVELKNELITKEIVLVKTNSDINEKPFINLNDDENIIKKNIHFSDDKRKIECLFESKIKRDCKILKSGTLKIINKEIEDNKYSNSTERCQYIKFRGVINKEEKCNYDLKTNGGINFEIKESEKITKIKSDNVKSTNKETNNRLNSTDDKNLRYDMKESCEINQLSFNSETFEKKTFNGFGKETPSNISLKNPKIANKLNDISKNCGKDKNSIGPKTELQGKKCKQNFKQSDTFFLQNETLNVSENNNSITSNKEKLDHTIDLGTITVDTSESNLSVLNSNIAEKKSKNDNYVLSDNNKNKNLKIFEKVDLETENHLKTVAVKSNDEVQRLLETEKIETLKIKKNNSVDTEIYLNENNLNRKLTEKNLTAYSEFNQEECKSNNEVILIRNKMKSILDNKNEICDNVKNLNRKIKTKANKSIEENKNLIISEGNICSIKEGKRERKSSADEKIKQIAKEIKCFAESYNNRKKNDSKTRTSTEEHHNDMLNDNGKLIKGCKETIPDSTLYLKHSSKNNNTIKNDKIMKECIKKELSKRPIQNHIKSKSLDINQEDIFKVKDIDKKKENRCKVENIIDSEDLITLDDKKKIKTQFDKNFKFKEDNNFDILENNISLKFEKKEALSNIESVNVIKSAKSNFNSKTINAEYTNDNQHNALKLRTSAKKERKTNNIAVLNLKQQSWNEFNFLEQNRKNDKKHNKNEIDPSNMMQEDKAYKKVEEKREGFKLTLNENHNENSIKKENNFKFTLSRTNKTISKEISEATDKNDVQNICKTLRSEKPTNKVFPTKNLLENKTSKLSDVSSSDSIDLSIRSNKKNLIDRRKSNVKRKLENRTVSEASPTKTIQNNFKIQEQSSQNLKSDRSNKKLRIDEFIKEESNGLGRVFSKSSDKNRNSKHNTEKACSTEINILNNHFKNEVIERKEKDVSTLYHDADLKNIYLDNKCNKPELCEGIQIETNLNLENSNLILCKTVEGKDATNKTKNMTALKLKEFVSNTQIFPCDSSSNSPLKLPDLTYEMMANILEESIKQHGTKIVNNLKKQKNFENSDFNKSEPTKDSEKFKCYSAIKNHSEINIKNKKNFGSKSKKRKSDICSESKKIKLSPNINFNYAKKIEPVVKTKCSISDNELVKDNLEMLADAATLKRKENTVECKIDEKYSRMTRGSCSEFEKVLIEHDVRSVLYNSSMKVLRKKRGRPKNYDSSSISTDDNVLSGNEIKSGNGVEEIAPDKNYCKEKEIKESKHHVMEEGMNMSTFEPKEDDKIKMNDNVEENLEIKKVLETIKELTTKLEMSKRSDTDCSEKNSLDIDGIGDGNIDLLKKNISKRQSLETGISIVEQKDTKTDNINEKKKAINAIFKKTSISIVQQNSVDNSNNNSHSIRHDNFSDKKTKNFADDKNSFNESHFSNIKSNLNKIEVDSNYIETEKDTNSGINPIYKTKINKNNLNSKDPANIDFGTMNCLVKIKRYSNLKSQDNIKIKNSTSSFKNNVQEFTEEKDEHISVIEDINRFNKKLLNFKHSTDHLKSTTENNAPLISETTNKLSTTISKSPATTTILPFSDTESFRHLNNVNTNNSMLKQVQSNTSNNTDDNYFNLSNESVISNRSSDTINCTSLFPTDLDLSDIIPDVWNLIPEDKNLSIHSTPDRQRANSDLLEKIINEDGDSISNSIKVDFEFESHDYIAGSGEIKKSPINIRKNFTKEKSSRHLSELKTIINDPISGSRHRFEEQSLKNISRKSLDVTKNLKILKLNNLPILGESKLRSYPSVPSWIVRKDKQKTNDNISRKCSSKDDQNCSNFHTCSPKMEFKETSILISPSKLDSIISQNIHKKTCDVDKSDQFNLYNMPILEESVQNSSHTLTTSKKHKLKISKNDHIIVGTQLPKKVPQFHDTCDNFNQTFNKKDINKAEDTLNTQFCKNSIRENTKLNFQSSYEKFTADIKEKTLYKQEENLALNTKRRSLVVSQQIITPPSTTFCNDLKKLNRTIPEQKNIFLNENSVSMLKTNNSKPTSSNNTNEINKISAEEQKNFNINKVTPQTSGIFIVKKIKDHLPQSTNKNKFQQIPNQQIDTSSTRFKDFINVDQNPMVKCKGMINKIRTDISNIPHKKLETNTFDEFLQISRKYSDKLNSQNLERGTSLTHQKLPKNQTALTQIVRDKLLFPTKSCLSDKSKNNDDLYKFSTKTNELQSNDHRVISKKRVSFDDTVQIFNLKQ